MSCTSDPYPTAIPSKPRGQSSASSLVFLPTELLLILFDDLKDTALLNLGQTCRLLNNIALPIFLQRKGIPHPESESITIQPFHNGHLDELAGLILNFSLHTVKNLVCILDCRPEWEFEEDFRLAALSRSPIAGFTQNLRRMQQLVRRLTSLGSLSISFYPLGAVWSLHSTDIQEFVAVLFHLLDDAIAKSCTSFQISHPHPLTMKPPYKFELLKGSRRFFPRIVGKMLSFMHNTGDSYLRGNGWRYRKMFKYSPVPTPAPHIQVHNKLTNLQLSSDFLLLPPFTSWTFGVMKHSPITSLSLSLPRIISQDEFQHYIFPHIVNALPQLQELRIGCITSDFFPAIVQLLPRLSQLRKLTFGCLMHQGCMPLTVRFPLTAPSSPMISLPNLVTFTGLEDQAVDLFGGSVSCPNLTSVNLIIDCVHGRPNLKVIAKKLAVINHGLSNMKPAPEINICLSNNITYPALPSDERAMNKWRECMLPFAVVSRLTLETASCDHEHVEATCSSLSNTLDYVSKWLEVFSGLAALTLITHQICADEELLSAGILMDYPNIVTFNVVRYHSERFHCHWASSSIAWGREQVFPLPRIEWSDGCVCSDF